jgi:hypothetical protein
MNDKKAKRYLLDLSKEVQTQLDQLCQSTGRQQSERESLIGKLKQFEELCASTKGKLNSSDGGKDGAEHAAQDIPTLLNRALSRTLDQEQEIKGLHHELAELRQAKAKSEQQLHKSLTDHIAAARQSARAEESRMRQERETALRQLRAMHDAQLTEHKIESADETVRLTEKLRSEFANDTAHYRAKIDALLVQQQETNARHHQDSMASRCAMDLSLGTRHTPPERVLCVSNIYHILFVLIQRNLAGRTCKGQA